MLPGNLARKHYKSVRIRNGMQKFHMPGELSSQCTVFDG